MISAWWGLVLPVVWLVGWVLGHRRASMTMRTGARAARMRFMMGHTERAVKILQVMEGTEYIHQRQRFDEKLKELGKIEEKGQ